jgi:hypothetical protein
LIADDHGFSPAEVEPGRRGLVGHPPGKPEDIAEGVLFGRERKETGPAEGGTQRGGVYGDDGPEAGRRIVEEHDLLVLIVQRAEYAHGCRPGGRGPNIARAMMAGP